MNRQPTLSVVFAILILVTIAMPTPVAAQATTVPDTAQIVLQSGDITPDGRLTFAGKGFAANERTSVSLEDDQGTVLARLDPVTVESDGQINMVSVPVPGGLAPGQHTLRIAGLTSGRFGRAVFQLQWQPPAVQLDAYTGKPSRTFGVSGTGFVPGEQVDVYLGVHTTTTDPLATVSADSRGDITVRDMKVPPVSSGDYSLDFVGRDSHTPVSVGFNVQGFHPWAVLDNYYLSPQSSVGFAGVDFVPGEVVQVYLNTLLSQPVAQVTADADGRFTTRNAFNLPDLTGNNQLIFVGQQSQTEVIATFAAAASSGPLLPGDGSPTSPSSSSSSPPPSTP